MESTAARVCSGLVTAHDLRAHFHGAVDRAVANQHVQLSPHSRSYLVNLLADFVNPARLFEAAGDSRFIRPLAEHYEQAQAARNEGDRQRALRRLGDIALFMAGAFGDALKRRLVDVDYYVAMGGAAYGYLAGHEPRGRGEPVFCELEEKFVSCMDVVAEASERRHGGTDSDILRLYEKWLRTGSERSAARLQTLGIFVSDASSLAQH